MQRAGHGQDGSGGARRGRRRRFLAGSPAAGAGGAAEGGRAGGPGAARVFWARSGPQRRPKSEGRPPPPAPARPRPLWGRAGLPRLLCPAPPRRSSPHAPPLPPQEIGRRVYTTREVVAEIRDRETRRRLAVLPYELRFREPFPEYVRLGEPRSALRPGPGRSSARFTPRSASGSPRALPSTWRQ